MKAAVDVTRRMKKGSCIETFTSFKYAGDDIRAMASAAGYAVSGVYATSRADSHKFPNNIKIEMANMS